MCNNASISVHLLLVLLDRISPNVNPEMLVLPPDLPYRRRSTTDDNYLIEEDLKTWSRTSDDYVKAFLYEMHKLGPVYIGDSNKGLSVHDPCDFVGVSHGELLVGE
jgi:hypothetical protein